ncbi:flagellar biosynthetic protein FliR [Bacillus suaedaesalsae]|uniref:Flagellar biosynthetic protein FliR n=1 Tax=Bacillus suaedaesalsae TaxID=2810349 RepID=A0ABS2DIW8_9BACI|nr:flagellar biosynthetic protein FliR [Bacillus suaedaesalsae]MBM6618430.1 flagellar type III secretion system protein FliR [Bacillus suaedaesalsae]
MEEFVVKISAFILILVRVTSFFVTVPIFSYRTIPAMHRVGMAFFLSWIMYYTVEIPSLQLDEFYILLILKEIAVGLSIGLIAYIIMSAIQSAGGFIDFQMGFAIANVVDPQTGAQSPLMGQFLYIVSLLFLLSVNGHHLLIDGIFYSYKMIPLDQIWVPFGDEQLLNHMIKTFNSMFIIAFQMSMPLVGSLFLIDVALGIIARTVPQLNIFVVGMPLKIGAAFIMLIVLMSVFFMLVGNLFEQALYAMRGLMQIIGGA